MRKNPDMEWLFPNIHCYAVQASIAANTYVISGPSQTKSEEGIWEEVKFHVLRAIK